MVELPDGEKNFEDTV